MRVVIDTGVFISAAIKCFLFLASLCSIGPRNAACCSSPRSTEAELVEYLAMRMATNFSNSRQTAGPT